MVIDMNDEQLQILAEPQAFLTGRWEPISGWCQAARCDIIARTLRCVSYGYGRPKRAAKGLVLRFVERRVGTTAHPVGN